MIGSNKYHLIISLFCLGYKKEKVRSLKYFTASSILVYIGIIICFMSALVERFILITHIYLMFIALLKVELYLEGSFSLKDKRHRLKKIKDHFGKKTYLAICESGFHDSLKRSQWSFVCIANDKSLIHKHFSVIEKYLVECIDAKVTVFDHCFL